MDAQGLPTQNVINVKLCPGCIARTQYDGPVTWVYLQQHSNDATVRRDARLHMKTWFMTVTPAQGCQACLDMFHIMAGKILDD